MSFRITRTDGPAGYIALYRRIFDHPVWTQLTPAVLKVMIAFLLEANWLEKTWYDGTAEIVIPRGSFVTSYPQMANKCKLTVKQVRLAFKHLEKLEVSAYRRAGRWTMVTVLNYGVYQDRLSQESKLAGGIVAPQGAR